MAITKLLKIKASKHGKPSSGLLQCLRYIANPDKTENRLLIGGSSGGDPDLTYEDMVANKQSWGKTDGTQGYHYILSLPPNETPDLETMRSLTEEFCHELLQENYLYAYAIHDDKKHIHSHIVFDSVSFTDGKMFHSGKYDWLARIQPITDRLCEKYGLRSLSFDPEHSQERKNRYHAEWEDQNANTDKPKKEVTWTDIIRKDVDAALAVSNTWSDFLKALAERHYEIKDGKNLSIRPEGKDRFLRTGRLGAGYVREELMRRLGEVPHPDEPYGDPESMLAALRESMERLGETEIKGFRVCYFERWYAFSYCNQSRAPWRYRQQLTDLGKYTDRCTYLFKHDITSQEELAAHFRNLHDQQATVKKEITRINNQIYNTPVAAWRKLEKLRASLDTLSEVERPKVEKQISNLMRELKDVDIMTEAAKYRSLQFKKAELLQKSGALKAELKIVEDLLMDYDKSRDPEDIMQDPGRYIPEPFTAKAWQRITLNRVLLINAGDDPIFLRAKIPGTEEYLVLYRADTKMASDQSYASTYIYNHMNYRVIDAVGNHIRSISGTDAMKLFDDRTRERRNQHGR